MCFGKYIFFDKLVVFVAINVRSGLVLDLNLCLTDETTQVLVFVLYSNQAQVVTSVLQRQSWNSVESKYRWY